MPHWKILIAEDRPFWLGLSLLLALALGHPLWATSLDGFTIDEPYHIAAGASYVRWGDYRLNPEHPPLVKLFAGLAQTLHLVPRAYTWYELARQDAATDPDILKDVEQQIERVKSAPAGTLVPILRDPSKE